MKCEHCHKEISEGEEMWEKLKGEYVPTHRDCRVGYECDKHGRKIRKKTTNDQTIRSR